MDHCSLKNFNHLLALNLGVAQADNHKLFEFLKSLVPFEIFRFPSGSEHNGWVVNDDWRVHKAVIKRRGKVVFDGTSSPLAVAGYSCSFAGTISKAELNQHIYCREDLPTAYPFHSAFNYRPWMREWGFCIPYKIYSGWPDDDYQVELITEYSPNEMLVGELIHHGELEDTILFNAHTCHPAQFNDGLSGVCIILELFRWLQERATRYTYLGILAPEHVGTVFYVATQTKKLQSIKQGVFVEMVGTKGPLVLQKSLKGNSIGDQLAKFVLKQMQGSTQVGHFRSIVGNDETVWESPGIEIPTICISRAPYPEYHTNYDNLEIISSDKMEESLAVLKNFIEVLEQDRIPTRKFDGLVALSNPKYNLYFERPDPTWKKSLSQLDLALGKLQDYLPRYLDSNHSIFEVANAFEVPFEQLLSYMKKMEEKGLINLEQLRSFSEYECLLSKPRLGFQNLHGP